MKPSKVATLFATLSFAALLSASVRADGYLSTDSKHAHSHASAPANDYAKFLWLCSDGAGQDTSVTHIVVSLADQRLYAYHDQQLIAWSNISSGRPGHETPTGSFTVSEKDVDHHSSIYDNAPMPYFMRLTDGGVGLHAGVLPGYAASHGCVRLPYAMVKELYQHVESGTPVDIIGDSVTSTVAQTPSVTGTVHLAQD